MSQFLRSHLVGVCVALARSSLRICALLGVAMVVSCADSTTLPIAVARTPSLFAGAEGVLMLDVDTVSVTRSVTAIDAAGRSTIQQVEFKRIRGGAAVRHGASAPTVSARETPPNALSALPLPILSMPAHVRYGRQAAGPWTSSIATEAGTVLEASGANGAPPSVVKMIRNGSLVLTIEHVWRRSSEAWDLVSQRTTSADGKFDETITIHHSSDKRPELRNSSRGSFGRNSLTVGGADALDALDDCVTAKCAVAANHFLTASIVYGAAIAGATFACLTSPIGLPLCVAAAASVVAAKRDWDEKKSELANCRATAEAECRKCFAADAVGMSPIGTGSIWNGRKGGIGFPTSGPTRLDECTVTWEWTDPNTYTPPTGGGGDLTYIWCYYWVEWDEYGDIVSVVLLYCDEET